MTKGTGKGAQRWKISQRGGAAAGHRRAPRLGAAPAVRRHGHGHRQGPRRVARRRRRPGVLHRRRRRGRRRAPARRSSSSRSETSPEDVHGMMVAEGILTARGGLVSHAAVVARGWGTPAVVGAESVKIHGKSFTVERGHRQRGRLHLARRLVGRGRARRRWRWPTPSRRRSSRRILGWADTVRSKGRRPMGVRANADTGEDAAKARELGAEGIGLCRTEHMFLAPDRLPVVRRMILATTAGRGGRRARGAARGPAGRLHRDPRGDGRPAR